jgi:tetratricopeptide (TPR) repeat protein
VSKHNDRHKYESLVLKGFSAPMIDIKSLETRLLENPSDYEARFQLLGYYSGKQYDDNVAAKELYAMTIWLIDNMPDCGVIENWGCTGSEIDQAQYEELKRHWLTQIEADNNNLRVIGCAAAYFSQDDEDLAEKLYQRAITLEPTTSDWSRDLAWLLGHRGPERALDAVNAMREALRKEPEQNRQYYMLDDLAELAFKAGNLEEASEAALKSLSLAFTFGKDWNDGNAIHNANSILGRIALKKGDIAAAKKHLVLAGETTGSPQLNSFGPEMKLAEELFAVGEIESVVAYLEACKKFWSSDCECGALDRGIAQIRSGEIPNFADRFAVHECDGGMDCEHE